MTNTITLPPFDYSMAFVVYRQRLAPNGRWLPERQVWQLPREEARAMLAALERDYAESMHEADSRRGRGSARARRIIRDVERRCADIDRARQALIAGLGGNIGNVVPFRAA